MYKCKLQELCQKRSWDLPDYETVKDGPQHMPFFTASVKVKGQVFETPTQCKSAKNAQNTAARIAFQHFNVPPPRRFNPQPSLSSASTLHGVIPTRHPIEVADSLPQPSPTSAPTLDVIPADPLSTVSIDTPLPEMERVDAVGLLDIVSPLPSSLPLPPPGLLVPKNNARDHEDTKTSMASIDSLDMLHLYKSGLQQYAQRKNVSFPVYTYEAEGPPHAHRFKSRVSIGGKSYETLGFFPTLKEAEQASAKVACQVLSIDVIQEDGRLYKNLLQVFAQKKGLSHPSYVTVSSGWSHKPKFVSSVEIGNNSFQGAEAKTKKQAEMNAAKVAYCAFTESFQVAESLSLSSSMGCAVTDNLAQNVEPTAKIIEDQDPTNEGFQVAESLSLSSSMGCAVTDNLAQNVEPTAKIIEDQDPTNEESQMHEERAKSSPEKDEVNANSPSDDLSLISLQMEHSAIAKPVTELPIEAKSSTNSDFPDNI